ncbi:universal stress protein [Luteimicrobium subarcticum]|uniref:universal stress protein n=1 Tax=Luteimicrobium subarcticum TaxID=620910 RepID=UPI000C24B949|nr:universal stress protein [Luteimicrobium subarcticum]
MTVLLAYNDTPQGNAALEVAVDEATRRGTTLALLCLTAQADDGRADSEAAHAASQLPDALAHPPVVFRTHDQVPADAILDAAERIEPELVVLGARRRPDVGMFLLGTTTQRVLLDSPVPVLVVKGTPDA